jgi:hypothetical protein
VSLCIPGVRLYFHEPVADGPGLVLRYYSSCFWTFIRQHGIISHPSGIDVYLPSVLGIAEATSVQLRVIIVGPGGLFAKDLGKRSWSCILNSLCSDTTASATATSCTSSS